MNFLKKQWFFAGIVVVVVLAFLFPALGTFVREYSIVKIGIFLAFLVTGMTLDTSEVLEQLKDIKILLAAAVSALILFPVVAYFCANLVFADKPDFIIGVLLIGAAPVTVASGTVMTGMARGNIPLSLFICVICNGLAILTMPPILNLFVSLTEPVQLPIGKMMTSLVMTVLTPTLLGQVLRPEVKKVLAVHKKKISIFNQTIVLLIIFNAVAGSTSKLVEAGGSIVSVFIFMLVLHNLYLLFNYLLARGIRLNRPSVAAFTIHTSQKTLTVSYLVWAEYLAENFPMALIPGIAYHLTQSICDTILAQKMGRLQEG